MQSLSPETSHNTVHGPTNDGNPFSPYYKEATSSAVYLAINNEHLQRAMDNTHL